MAKYRVVYTQFWDDPKVVEEMTPEDKYIFLYLLTNKNTRQIGVYTITKKQMAFDTGYSQETIQSILERLIDKHKLVKYNPETREIAIKNWGKYNFIRGGKPVEDCVSAELEKVKDVKLIQYVGEHIRNGRMREIYESYVDSSFELSKNGPDDQPIRDGLDDTSTIRGQKEKQKEKEKEKQLLGGRCGQVFDFYQQNFGILSPFIAEEIGESVDEFGEPLVIEAMKISLSVGKRNWRYTYGILKRWRDEQVKTLEDLWALERVFEQQKKALPMTERCPNVPGIYQHNPSEGEDLP
ncbi:DnaD domain protein [Cytobacillus depressus]|uniref:DnaD domain protein n=1 Tax=Cytobacillus depressus TaxID=1602942 RepID=A0A6L3V4X9_9BACI|nr:DnaD domain protein [Cytobacillus depressus]KAB2336174.1 DnaD domain protein [Cytobacillus depressus]